MTGWTRRLAVWLLAVSVVLAQSVTAVWAAPGTSESGNHGSAGASVKGDKGSATTAETETVTEEEPESDVPECQPVVETTDGTTDGSTSDTTTDPAPAPVECPAPAPEPAPDKGAQADVNLTGKGKAVEHNPNVDANGQLQPGTAAEKSDETSGDETSGDETVSDETSSDEVAGDETAAPADSTSAKKAKADHVAKVKAESVAKAKAERDNGEKGAYLVYVNGERLNLTPLEKSGRTMVPFRRLAEFLGGTVSWEPSTQTITMVSADGKTVVMQIGSTTAVVDGATVEMPLAPELVESSTYVPLRFIAEAFGADVDYSEETGAITVITSPEAPETTTPPADDTTTPPADDTTTPPADDTTTPPADDTTTPPADDTTTPPADDTTTPPADDTTTPPADGTATGGN